MINDRYVIGEKLGEGRSSVYLCKDLQNNGVESAIKVLAGNVSDVEKGAFLQEFYMLQNLDHPSIIKVRDKGEIFEWSDKLELSRGDLFFTQEYFKGQNLTSFTNPDEDLLLNLIVKLSDVLFYLHQSKYVYYDLKPENILYNVNDNLIDLKLIDFGLAKYAPPAIINTISGSTEYIAPELLRKESHDRRVDLYSLGILLYKIIYNRFPFTAKSEIEIYKAQLEENFEFPETKYSPQIISVVKKLLDKNPVERYSTSLEIIAELNPYSINQFIPYWGPAKIFTNRPDAIRILKKYLTDKDENDVFTVKGSLSTGKTAILREFNKLVPGSIYINYDLTKTGIEFIKVFLSALLYSPAVYNTIDDEQKLKIKTLIKAGADNIIEEVKSIISYVSRNCDFTLLFDNYNNADEYVTEIFRNLIPILQVNKRKLILSEDIDKDLSSTQIPNRREINLTPFTDNNLSEYLNASYSSFFPINDLKKSIMLYADLVPGNIVSFIKDLLILKVIRYSSSGISVDNSEATSMILQTSHDNIYRLRLLELNNIERHVINFISALNTPIDEPSLDKLIDSRLVSTKQIIEKLRILNILQRVNQTNNLIFTGEGLKKFIYKNVDEKKSLHLLVANSLSSLNFNRVELARQYELGGAFDKAFDILYSDISEAIKVSAYSYARSYLEKIIQFPVDKEKIFAAKRDLADVLFNLSHFQNALKLIDDLINEAPKENIDDLLLLKASSLTGNGDYEEAKNLLLTLEPKIISPSNKRTLLVELANAEFELSNYVECTSICKKIINDQHSSIIEKGKCYNFLGLINIFFENNLANALNYFILAEDLYLNGGIIFKAAQMQMNLGNIYNMKGEPDKAELFWNKSFKTIISIGNLEFEAKLLLNFGIYHFDKVKFEESIENYNKALSIFTSLGNSAGQGLVLYNMGEIYLVLCEYQKSLELLNTSVQIFSRLKNLNEELESLFLLAKVYYIVGDMNQFLFISEIISNKVVNESVAGRHKVNYSFLKTMAALHSGEVDNAISSLKTLFVKYKELDDRVNYCYCSFIYITVLIKNKMYMEALAQLKEQDLINYSSESPVLNTERIYLTGLLAKESDVCEKPAFDYLLEAAEFVQSSSIIEITWKIFFTLGELYEIRGTINKAEEYFQYAKSVLEYIIGNTTDNGVKYALMNNPARIEAYNKLVKSKEGSVND